MIVRQFRLPDADAVTELMVALIEHIRNESKDPYFRWASLETDFLRSNLLKTLDNPDRKIFVVEDQSQVVGFLEAAVIPCFLPFSLVEEIGQIFAAYIDPAHRGCGLVEQLEAAAVSFFSSRGLRYVELHALSRNAIAVHTWTRLGYQTFRVQMRKSI